jgi:hypothetical protein
VPASDGLKRAWTVSDGAWSRVRMPAERRKMYEECVEGSEVSPGHFVVGLRMKEEYRATWRSHMMVFERCAYDRLHPADQAKVSAHRDPFGALHDEIKRVREIHEG